MVLVDKVGEVVAFYDKIHLFFVADEEKHFSPGKRTVVTHWEGLDVGLAICFDLRFPEMTRKLCDDGARIVLVSAQWPRARVDHFRDFTRVRAMENQLYLVSCNSCGDDGKGLVLGGGSTVVGPSGEVRGVLDDDEGVLTVNIDLEEVERIRESFPVLKVRRKDVFGE
jgi:predicted amidohydrolase